MVKEIIAPKPGVYIPVPTFFQHDGESIDKDTIGRHAVRLAAAGVTGLVVMGSTGEAVFLSAEERKEIICTHRQALDAAGHHNFPLIVGAGAQSVKESIELVRSAADAGADYVICVTPGSYFAGALKDKDIIKAFLSIADASPVPVMLYNFPGVTNGINLSSDVIKTLAAHPNIVGIKLTEFDTGKCARVALTLEQHKFAVFSGVTDNMVQTMAVNGAGAITGLGNIVPKLCVALYRAIEKGDVATAHKLQLIAAESDKIGLIYGVVGTREGLCRLYGYGGVSRAPLPSALNDGVWDQNLAKIMSEAMTVEKSL